MGVSITPWIGRVFVKIPEEENKQKIDEACEILGITSWTYGPKIPIGAENICMEFLFQSRDDGAAFGDMVKTSIKGGSIALHPKINILNCM